MYSTHKKLKTETLQTRNVRSIGFIFSQIICAFCFLTTYAIYVGSHLWNALVDLCQTKRVRFDLVNILAAQKNVLHLSEFSAKSENSVVTSVSAWLHLNVLKGSLRWASMTTVMMVCIISLSTRLVWLIDYCIPSHAGQDNLICRINFK